MADNRYEEKERINENNDISKTENYENNNVKNEEQESRELKRILERIKDNQDKELQLEKQKLENLEKQQELQEQELKETQLQTDLQEQDFEKQKKEKILSKVAKSGAKVAEAPVKFAEDVTEGLKEEEVYIDPSTAVGLAWAARINPIIGVIAQKIFERHSISELFKSGYEKLKDKVEEYKQEKEEAKQELADNLSDTVGQLQEEAKQEESDIIALKDASQKIADNLEQKNELKQTQTEVEEQIEQVVQSENVQQQKDIIDFYPSKDITLYQKQLLDGVNNISNLVTNIDKNITTICGVLTSIESDRNRLKKEELVNKTLANARNATGDISFAANRIAIQQNRQYAQPIYEHQASSGLPIQRPDIDQILQLLTDISVNISSQSQNITDAFDRLETAITRSAGDVNLRWLMLEKQMYKMFPVFSHIMITMSTLSDAFSGVISWFTGTRKSPYMRFLPRKGSVQDKQYTVITYIYFTLEEIAAMFRRFMMGVGERFGIKYPRPKLEPAALGLNDEPPETGIEKLKRQAEQGGIKGKLAKFVLPYVAEIQKKVIEPVIKSRILEDDLISIMPELTIEHERKKVLKQLEESRKNIETNRIENAIKNVQTNIEEKLASVGVVGQSVIPFRRQAKFEPIEQFDKWSEKQFKEQTKDNHVKLITDKITKDIVSNVNVTNVSVAKEISETRKNIDNLINSLESKLNKQDKIISDVSEKVKSYTDTNVTFQEKLINIQKETVDNITTFEKRFQDKFDKQQSLVSRISTSVNNVSEKVKSYTDTNVTFQEKLINIQKETADKTIAFEKRFQDKFDKQQSLVSRITNTIDKQTNITEKIARLKESIVTTKDKTEKSNVFSSMSEYLSNKMEAIKNNILKKEKEIPELDIEESKSLTDKISETFIRKPVSLSLAMVYGVAGESRRNLKTLTKDIEDKSLISKAYNEGKRKRKGIFNRLFSGIWNTVKSVFRLVTSALGSVLGGAFTGIKKILGMGLGLLNPLNWFKGFVSLLTGSLKLVFRLSTWLTKLEFKGLFKLIPWLGRSALGIVQKSLRFTLSIISSVFSGMKFFVELGPKLMKMGISGIVRAIPIVVSGAKVLLKMFSYVYLVYEFFKGLLTVFSEKRTQEVAEKLSNMEMSERVIYGILHPGEVIGAAVRLIFDWIMSDDGIIATTIRAIAKAVWWIIKAPFKLIGFVWDYIIKPIGKAWWWLTKTMIKLPFKVADFLWSYILKPIVDIWWWIVKTAIKLPFNVIGFVWDYIIKPVGSLIVTIITGIITAPFKLANIVYEDIIKPVAGALGNAILFVFELPGKVISAIKRAIFGDKDVKETILQFFREINPVRWLTELFVHISNVIKTQIEKIKTTISDVVSSLTNINLKTVILGGIFGLVSAIVGGLARLVKTSLGWIPFGLGDKVKQKVQDTGEKLVEWAASYDPEVANIVRKTYSIASGVDITETEASIRNPQEQTAQALATVAKNATDTAKEAVNVAKSVQHTQNKVDQKVNQVLNVIIANTIANATGGQVTGSPAFSHHDI